MNFFEQIDVYQSTLNPLINESNDIKYQCMFMEPNLNIKPTLDEVQIVMQIYTFGILERLHLASITSLARTLKWLNSTKYHASDGNLLAFSASLRGFVEASADSFDLMKFLPATICKNLKLIYIQLKNPSLLNGAILSFKNLEDRLIHYSHARKIKKNDLALPNHTNKHNADYIMEIEKFGANKSHELYAELCELTHPASSSVMCFVDETDRSMTLNFTKEKLAIEKILTKYNETLINLLQFSANTASETLSYLNVLIPEWPALPIDSNGHIGNIKKNIDDFNYFVNNFNPSSVDIKKLIAEAA